MYALAWQCFRDEVSIPRGRIGRGCSIPPDMIAKMQQFTGVLIVGGGVHALKAKEIAEAVQI